MAIADVKRVYEEGLLKRANVVGVAVGYKVRGGEKTGQISIVCMVEKKISKEELKKKDVIPSTIEKFQTDVIEVGELKALASRTDRYRPSPMGTSGGHYKITAGTNGELLKDKKTGKMCIGTNNHVGANSNDARIGDPYLQPGPADGGKIANDTIGRLLRYVPIKFVGEPSQCPVAKLWGELYNIPASILGRRTRMKAVVETPEYNLVDAAMVEVAEKDVLAEILDVGVPKGVADANLDMLVQKSGRTTGRTFDGPITGIDATVGPVSYGTGKLAYFKDQIIIGKEGFSAGGDSGSLVLNMEGYAVGKLFAGSDKVTIANRIQNYLQLLEAEIVR